MMKFVRRFPDTWSVALYSTEVHTPSSKGLFQKLRRCNAERVSVIPVLDEWVAQGNRMHIPELLRFIKTFRTNGRVKPALEISEWMSLSMENFKITPGHVAIQLDLISKVRGVEQAENFFNGVEDYLKDFRVYSALLNCYAEARLLDKAEATMEKIRKYGSHRNLPYNTMLGLYSKMGMHEKLDLLMEEMKTEGINFNMVTYRIRLNAYADSDLEEMEKFLVKMEAEPEVPDNVCAYTIVAKGYIKVGALEKALWALKKAECLIPDDQRRFEYGPLISLYATMQRRDEVYRLWNLLRICKNLQYESYVYILCALEKLDDLDGAKGILKEWEEKSASTDFRIPNLVIGAFCRKGDVGEAEFILERLIKNGKKPCAKTCSHMALGYFKNGQMEEAVIMTKMAFLNSYAGWKPDLTTVAACIKHLKKKGDENEMQEMLMLLKKR